MTYSLLRRTSNFAASRSGLHLSIQKEGFREASFWPARTFHQQTRLPAVTSLKRRSNIIISSTLLAHRTMTTAAMKDHANGQANGKENGSILPTTTDNLPKQVQ